MTAAGLVAYDFSEMHLVPKFVRFYKITASDWIDTTLLTPHPLKGFLPINAWHVSATANTVANDIIFGAVTINNASTAYTATDTTIAVDTISPYLVGPRTPPYYVMFGTAAGFEIMEVVTDSLHLQRMLQTILSVLC
jgi:hypothetical protein